MRKVFAAALLLILSVPAAAQKAITVKGSDTMVIMNAKFAESFMARNPGAIVQVTGGGSGVGLAALINGTTDIAASSRPIRPGEVDKLKQRFATLGVTVPVARDGLAVYLNTANPVQQLTLDQIRDIYIGKLTNWQEVGGKNAPIVLYSRENSSGTYVYFKEFVLRNKDYSPRAQTLQGTAAVVNAVAKDPNGIGYGGAAYAKGVRFAQVKKDANSPGYLPTLETIKAGQYPITRYLYYYLRSQPKGDMKKFVDWILSAEGQATVQKVGYFPVK